MASISVGVNIRNQYMLINSLWWTCKTYSKAVKGHGKWWNYSRVGGPKMVMFHTVATIAKKSCTSWLLVYIPSFLRFQPRWCRISSTIHRMVEEIGEKKSPRGSTSSWPTCRKTNSRKRFRSMKPRRFEEDVEDVWRCGWWKTVKWWCFTQKNSDFMVISWWFHVNIHGESGSNNAITRQIFREL